MTADPKAAEVRSDFIREIIDADLGSGKHATVVTRFPPEPNGYLHIGHAKSIHLNFGLAEQYGGRCHLRFDDTNPETEESEYAEAIERDVRWLGYEWDGLFHASDYFEQMYAYALELIDKGLAYVDSLSTDEIREYRGTATEPGRDSPYRDRPAAESRDLLERMRRGEFPDGAHVLRARIDMAHPNMKMRDPLLYRIRNRSHFRAGDAWHIYPMYDFAHCLEDSIEGVTHSICTLEFENNREVYDWILDHLEVPQPQPRQIEFARLNLTYTVMSKRKLLHLVRSGLVRGWDDPRMPTIAALRRRGVRPSAIRALSTDVGVAKANSTVEIERLDHAIRSDLNFEAPRVMGVLRPLEVELVDWPEDRVEWLDADYWPRDVPREGSRKVPFGRRLFIERDDFLEHPPKGFHRLTPGGEVRLRYGYVIRCEEVVKDAAGEIVRLRCTHDPHSAGGQPADGRKVKGTIHWVSADHAISAEVRLYDRLFAVERPDLERERPLESLLNPDSLEIVQARLEPSLAEARAGQHFQLERHGFFFVDPEDSREGAPVFNLTVPLKDAWARQTAQAAEDQAERRRQKQARKASAGQPAARPVALNQRGERYRDDLGLKPDDARVLSENDEVAAFFEAALAAHAAPESVARWIVNDLMARIKETGLGALPFDAERFAALVRLVDEGRITQVAGKEVLGRMAETGEDPQALVDHLGLGRVADTGALAAQVDAVLAAHPEEVARYREGKTALLGFFVGQVMKATRGQADAQALRPLLQEKLG